ncbi:MAG TPA: SusC/RagA family TonB-linked outer membrane protein [Fodinibius sp.]|nr:SusC/RagA family TonB-linked outer membrane protein [Fodinibius sp.]
MIRKGKVMGEYLNIPIWKWIGRISLLGILAGFLTLPLMGQIQQESNEQVVSVEYLKKLGEQEVKNNSQSSIILQKEISLKLRQNSLLEALKEVVKKGDLTLSYDTQLSVLENKLTLDLKQITIEDALWKILENTGLRFAMTSDDQLVLVRKYEEIPLETAQETISGTVTDAQSGETLPGVNILVKGTSTGASTDANGAFELTVESLQDTLVVTYIGYQRQEIAISGRTEINIELTSEAIMGEEMVVVGYGKQKKVNLTGSVSSITSEELTKSTVSQTGAALQGISPGVTVTQRSGQPGQSGGNIRIRGIGTLGDASPLVMVDGVEASLDNVNPEAIESISVLKDAASAAIYGSRAANGVILITTKRGSQGIRVNYNSSFSWKNPTDMPNIVNAVDHMEMINEAYTNTGRSQLYSDEYIETYKSEMPSDQYPDTDWQDLTMKNNAFMQDHTVSINTGSEHATIYGAINYIYEGGIIPNTNFKRYNIRLNSDINITEELSASLDIFLRQTEMNEPSNGTGYVFHWMRRIPSNELGVLSNGLYGEGWNGDHPLARAEEGGLHTQKTIDGILNFKLNYQPTDWLSVEGMYAPKLYSPHNKTFTAVTQTYQWNGTPSYSIPGRNSLTEQFSREWYNNLRLTATLDKEFKGKHQLSVLAGFQQEDQNNNWIRAYREVFPLPDYQEINSGSQENEGTAGSASHWALRSLFGRINYDFDDKYLFEANLRYDGSSRFAEGNRFALFPSVSAGWRISEEPFMQSTSDIIDNLKLRASWGQLGNQNIGLYPYASFVSIGGSNYVFNDAVSTGASLNDMSNPDIQWETTESVNFGLEAGLWGKFDITAEYYYKKTKDILLQLNIPQIIGLNAPYQNAGVVENRGWDLAVGYHNQSEDFRYDISLNLSNVENKILDMKGIERTGLTVNREGNPIGAFYGYEAIGLFQTEQEVEEHATQFGDVAPGDIKYRDLNEDGVINDADQSVIGSPVPQYTFGANFDFNYKGIDLSLFLQGVGKADGFMYGQGIQPFYLGGTVQEKHKDRWTPENTDASFPRFAFNETNNEQNSTFWMKDASYVRLKNMQLGYTIPDQWISDIQRLRIYVSARNLFTVDNFWKGYDPEAPVSNGGWYPQMRTFTLGLDVNF